MAKPYPQIFMEKLEISHEKPVRQSTEKKNTSHECLWCSCCMKMFKVCKAKAQSFFLKKFIYFWLCWVFVAVRAFL